MRSRRFYVPFPRITLLFAPALLCLCVAANAWQAADSLRDYNFSAPKGWTTTPYPDGIVLTSPASQTGERCMISLWPMRPAGPNILQDADLAFRQVFSTYEPRSQTSAGAPLVPSVTIGTSGQGWDYLILKRGIGKPRNQYGTWESLLGFIFIAKLNDRLAVISGLSKEPLISTCMGELVHNAWPEFFYSLGFRNWPAVDRSQAMRNALAGTWTSATATASDQFTLAANGRYGSASAAQQYGVLANGEGVTNTQAYFGNGAFTLRGNSITFVPDDHSRRTEMGYFRLEKESTDGGKTWAENLYVLRTSAIDGSQYEVRYRRR